MRTGMSGGQATILILLALFISSPAAAKVLHAAIALIVAGALGNLYDRLFAVVQLKDLEPVRGQVRDFIDCSDLYYPWVFNLADMLLVLGVAVLAIVWMRADKTNAKSRQS